MIHMSPKRGRLDDIPGTADHEKKAALAKLTISDTALAKIIERRRGRIRNYRPSPHGLIEWKQ